MRIFSTMFFISKLRLGWNNAGRWFVLSFFYVLPCPCRRDKNFIGSIWLLRHSKIGKEKSERERERENVITHPEVCRIKLDTYSATCQHHSCSRNCCFSCQSEAFSQMFASSVRTPGIVFFPCYVLNKSRKVEKVSVVFLSKNQTDEFGTAKISKYSFLMQFCASDIKIF